ncbi:tyrosine-type recombinase/integrase [Halovenus sp. HT40]|uniref:tyrosine-type recombinase/integrase n=1 Tax=Halovenus sp. HT40 TaxID=3126691 RepID=UPI00300EA373
MQTGHPLCDKYLHTVAGVEIQDSSAERYATALRSFVQYLTDKKSDVLVVKVGDVKEYLRHRTRIRLAKNTLKTDLTAINNLYKFIRLDTTNETEIDLFALSELNVEKFQARESVEIEPLEPAEVEKLAAAVNNPRDRLMILVCVETGARNESLRLLSINDIDLNENKVELHNTKTGGTYTAPISNELGLELERWIYVERGGCAPSADDGYLFPSSQQEKISGNELNTIVKSAAKRAGIQEVLVEREPTPAEKENGVSAESVKQRRVTTHTLRHTFSYMLEKAGAPTEVRSAALDHDSIKTTKQSYSYEGVDYEDFVRQFVHGNADADSDKWNT